MNNTIGCECLDCGNEFTIGVPDLLDEDQNTVIGEIVWCGVCDSHRYYCYWGLFPAGLSTERIKDVLQLWREWAESYGHERVLDIVSRLRTETDWIAVLEDVFGKDLEAIDAETRGGILARYKGFGVEPRSRVSPQA